MRAADCASLIRPTCCPSAAARLAALRSRIFTMLPKEIEAIVIAVWRSDDDACVEFRRLRIRQEHAGMGMVIELDKYHRALNPIVERTIVIGAADPAKICCLEMPLDLAKAAVQWPLGSPDRCSQTSCISARRCVAVMVAAFNPS